MERYATVILWSEADGGFVAMHPELPGCVAFGATQAEAIDLLNEFREAWIDQAKEEGRELPKPIVHEYTGKFTVRISRSLHRELTAKALANGVSLNQMASQLLAGGTNREVLPRASVYGGYLLTLFNTPHSRSTFKPAPGWLGQSFAMTSDDSMEMMNFVGRG